MNVRPILKGLFLIVSLAALGYLFHTSDLGNSINEAWIDSEVRGSGLHGVLLFLMMGGIFTAIGLPRQIIAFLGGYGFSVVVGTLLAALATLLGAILTFAYARFLGQGFLKSRLRGRAERFDQFVHDHPFSMTTMIRLLPVGSNLLINLSAGLSSIRAAPFFAGSIIGWLPQTLVFALVGSGVRVAPAFNLTLAVVLFLISAVLGLWLYQKYRQEIEDRGTATG